MKSVIPAANYTLDASESTITLSGDYTTVTEEQVISIRNITKNQLIYDSGNTNRGQISIVDGVITFTYSGQMEDTDNIQIEVDFPTSSIVTVDDTTPLDINIASSAISISSALSSDPIDYFFNAATVAASSESESLPIQTGDCVKVWIFCENATSTNLTVNIYAESSATSTDLGLIQPLNLNTSANKAVWFITDCPPYIKVKAVNADTVNAATVTVKMIKTR